MFNKKAKKKREISRPLNFEHRVHTDFDAQDQKYIGLPSQWRSFVNTEGRRPFPIVDPTKITPVSVVPMNATKKVIYGGREGSGLPIFQANGMGGISVAR